MFDVDDLEGSYPFAKTLYAMYIEGASEETFVMTLYDRWEEERAQEAGEEYAYSGLLDVTPDNTQLLTSGNMCRISENRVQPGYPAEHQRVCHALSVYFYYYSRHGGGHDICEGDFCRIGQQGCVPEPEKAGRGCVLSEMGAEESACKDIHLSGCAGLRCRNDLCPGAELDQ